LQTWLVGQQNPFTQAWPEGHGQELLQTPGGQVHLLVVESQYPEQHTVF
jgi:hypothetical protein